MNLRSYQRWIVAFLLLIVGAGHAAEPWADARLKSTDGLVLWLDAAGQNAARKAPGRAQLKDGTAIDVLFDSAGRQLHLSQPTPKSRPTLHITDNRPAIKFDGEDDFLQLPGLEQTFKDLTIIIAATPFSNNGEYRAFLAMNATNTNDYTSGLTLDMSAFGSMRFETFNPEGLGFGGAVDLLNESLDFGLTQRLAITTGVARGNVLFSLNGKRAGQRPRTDSTIKMDQVTLGARFYNNAGPADTRGFLDGEISEVLIYDRALTDEELAGIDNYLAEKHGHLRKVANPKKVAGKQFTTIPNPPAVQMFNPGFTARQLPLDLVNINNLLYRPDGKLVALAYNGNVYLLSDTDNDGLEDKAELFWENKSRLLAPIGMALTPPNYPHGNGLFVACKSKVSLIVDTDKDDKADKEIIVASGWKELSHGVDALGVAIDPRDNSVWFGLGCTDFTNAYLIDKTGKSGYDLKSERGTIMRIAPDLKSREIICTGIRFPVGMRFNSLNDLFCSDQEGGTWLANGNPLDELLHIQAGRHYGFPPRHPKFLPNVIDEPSTFDYFPQHQSTCGLNFNTPVNGGPTFGPAWWRDDALVAGYSRGKLYRTKLFKSATGYLAQSQLLGSLNMLTVDVAVSPKGDLVIANHSGAPDWGSGPGGKGKLYKVSYTEPDLAQPILAWSQSPREVRIAFDRPIDPAHLQRLASGITIEFGRHVAAGDRFEANRPGYQVVVNQMNTPRFDLPILSTTITADRRTLILATPPMSQAAGFAITLPGLGRVDPPAPPVPPPFRPLPPAPTIAQHPQTDVRYDLSGVEGQWKSADGTASWTGWLPHIDLAAARHFTTPSGPHEELFKLLSQPGTLTLNTHLNLTDMLRPAVQPGSTIDYAWPAEQVTLTFRASTRFELSSPGLQVEVPKFADTKNPLLLTISPKKSEQLIPITITLFTGIAPADLTVSWHTAEDPRPRPLPLHRMFLPWASLDDKPAPLIATRDLPELKGGSWTRGREVFFSEQALCSKCHNLHGRGGAIGPDLSNLIHRDYTSVHKDIQTPSAAINPDYIAYDIVLKNNDRLTGPYRTEPGDKLRVGIAAGAEVVIDRAQIKSMRPLGESIMPPDIDKALGPDKYRDLLTFLLTNPLDPAPIEAPNPPEPRSLAEIRKVLANPTLNPNSVQPAITAKLKPLHIVLCAAAKDHGPGEHDYPLWQKRWETLLSLAENVTVSTATNWPSADQLKSADVIIFFSAGNGWTADRSKDLEAYQQRGGGLVYLHYAVNGSRGVEQLGAHIGLVWKDGLSRFRHGALTLKFADTTHPITRNFDDVSFVDESYWSLIGDASKIHLLATTQEEKAPRPLLWTHHHANGRVFVNILGHYNWTFDDPLFRILTLRGVCWTAGEPADRLSDLATIGARLKP